MKNARLIILTTLLVASASLVGCEEKTVLPVDEAAERELVAEEVRRVRAAREAAHAEVEATLEESRDSLDELLPDE